ncbi:hypothetical protein C1645_880271 [Glomus cerebriforme]|uniref:DNA-directed DNA polymerase n=1 Tax=Glomus cerebriforme TaxID=658196 RepID=A0A397SMK1_9GLOM|nr:hypothetical protein C1645_880271 [Glomus cerebriforme]
MSGIFSGILGSIGNFIGNYLPIWGREPTQQETTESEDEYETAEEDNISETETESTSSDSSEDTEAHTISTSVKPYQEYTEVPTVSTSVKSYQDFHSRHYFASREILCYRADTKSKKFFIKVEKNEMLEEAYKRYIKESIAISIESNGLIDMRKTGTYAATSLRLFQDVTRGPIRSEILTCEEKLWITKTNIGAITWAEQYEGEATQYDINEFYPSLMKQNNVKWPTEKGKFKTLTNLNGELQYGIYRVNIEGSPKIREKQGTRLFRYNQEEYYTYFDIESMIKSSLQVKLMNVSPNAYVFDHYDLMDGKLIFENWTNILIKIKRKKGIAGNVAKKLLVSLWGKLTDIHKDGSHSRMKPFILALGRKTIVEVIRPLGDHVKRINTDGFIIANTNKINIQVGSNTGELKCEKKGHVIIKNINNISWSNIIKITNNSWSSINEISSSHKITPEKEIVLPNELISIIINYCKKVYPLLFVNIRWNLNARRILWNDIKLNKYAGYKFLLNINVKERPLSCEFVTSLSINGKIETNQDSLFSVLCKACPNLKNLSLNKCENKIANNKSLEKSLVKCKNLKSIEIIRLERISSSMIKKIPNLCPSLETLSIILCPRIRDTDDIIFNLKKSSPLLKIKVMKY